MSTCKQPRALHLTTSYAVQVNFAYAAGPLAWSVVAFRLV